MLVCQIMRRVCPIGLTLVSLLVFGAPAALAQGRQDRAFTLSAGPAPYDLSGTGTAGVVGLSVDLPVSRVLLVEPAVRYLRYTPQGGGRISFLLPEIGLQARLPGRISPYLGAGIGAGLEFGDHDDTQLTLHTAVGARLRVDRQWLLRTEARVRMIDPFAGSSVDLVVGVGRSF